MAAMSAHNAIDDLHVRLADIDAEIWQHKNALERGQSAASFRLPGLLEQREALLREAELRLLLRPRSQAELTPSTRVADVPYR